MEAINFAIDIVLIICGVLATWYAWVSAEASDTAV